MAAVSRCNLINSVVVPALSVAIGGFVIADPSSDDHDLASMACVLFSLLAFAAGVLLMFVAIAGVPLPPFHVEFLTSVALSAMLAVLILYPLPTTGRRLRE